ncbi:PIN-like domain-containing protein, partial [Actinomadura geliboluensis]|uniref:PIN-like domain-containing protein n=1 Tax=Actinomadura geliboluensis TaxID=882440 RepID=UPI003720518B
MTSSDKPESSAAPAGAAASKQSSMRELFPGYYPPAEDDVKTFITQGLVVFDTNALLNIYRFTEQARTEYLDTLRLLEDRLWVPHHVGFEFFNNRAGVISDCAAANDTLVTALGVPFEQARAMIDAFAGYRGLSASETEGLVQILDGAAAQILDKLHEIYDFTVSPGTDPDADPILREIETLLDGKIGPAFTEKEAMQATSDGKRRINNNIPPGYADRGKPGDKAIGDYLLWAQTIKKAKGGDKPILLVTNDEKEDWVHLTSSGQSLGPRTELVLEMKEKAGQKFHLVTVQMFLAHAKKYLSAHISDSTFDQAASPRRSDADAEDVDVGPADQETTSLSPLAAQIAAAGSASRLAAQAASSPTARLAAQIAAAGPGSALAAQIAAAAPASRLAAQIAASSQTAHLAAQIAAAAPVSRLAAQAASSPTARLAAQIAAAGPGSALAAQI